MKLRRWTFCERSQTSQTFNRFIIQVDVNLEKPETQHACFANEINDLFVNDSFVPIFEAKRVESGQKKKDVDTLIVAETLDLLCMKKNVVFAKDKAIKVSSCISSTQK